jgi:hypothetical protein
MANAKAPQAAPEGVAELLKVPGDMADIFADADEAMRSVLVDPVVWAEEMGRPEPEPLPWPIVTTPNTGRKAVFTWMMLGAVGFALDWVKAIEGDGSEIPKDPSDGRFQTVLRVAARAVDAAAARVGGRWDEPGRLSGWRTFTNWLKKRRMDQIARSGAKGKEAARLAGLGTSSSYRAQERKMPKKRK